VNLLSILICLILGLLQITPLVVLGQSGRRLDQVKQPAINALIPCSIKSGGLPRQYLVHLPPDYSTAKRSPLILAFHGGLGSASGMVRISKLNELADVKGAVVVYPEGIERHWQDGRKFGNKGTIDDVAFCRDLLAKLSQDYTIDPKRIYAIGLSNGGFFVQRLACEMPDKIAAVASVAASQLIGMNYRARQPVPIIFVLGTLDPIVPWAGGVVNGTAEGDERVYSADDTVAKWIKADHCAPTSKIIFEQKPGDETHFIATSYRSPTNDSEVVLCKVEGGGHCWPGGVQYLPRIFIGRTSSVKANLLIYDFFARHHL
jgi:polyhydroxybutyrate depolymerase